MEADTGGTFQKDSPNHNRDLCIQVPSYFCAARKLQKQEDATPGRHLPSQESRSNFQFCAALHNYSMALPYL